MIKAAATIALTAALTLAAAASAGTPDPRKCGNGTATVCAQNAAKLAARTYLQKKAGQAYPWQGPMTCTPLLKTNLKWSCSFSSSIPAVGSGAVVVWWRGTANGWKMQFSVVQAP